MTDMIERVARAICKAAGNDPDDSRNAAEWEWEVWQRHARAAIAAVREHDDILVKYAGYEGRRDWQDTGAWLYPGRAIAVIEIDDASPPPRDPAQD